MPTPAELRMAAQHLAAQASWLPAALDQIVGRSGPAVWRGPAADRFAEELQMHRRRLRALADELEMAARSCAADAADLEATAEQLRMERLSIPPRFS